MTASSSIVVMAARGRRSSYVGYDAIHDGLARAASTARGVSGTLRLGVMGTVSDVIRDVLDQFRRSNADCDLDIREIYFSDPFGPLWRDDADVVVLWRPIREPDLAEGPVVFREGRVLAVWTDHELAERASVSMEDLADHVAIDPAPHYWLEAILPSHTPSGRPIPRNGPRPTTFHELLSLVAARQCVTPANGHAVPYYSAHPGVTFIPIHDAPPTEWALVWRTAAETPLIRAFAQAARDVGPFTLDSPVAARESSSGAA